MTKAKQTPVHEEIISDPGAWQRSDFRDESQWIYPFNPATLRELDSALQDEPFRLPSFQQDLGKIRNELIRGRGFLLLRGIAVDNYTANELDHLYWGIGSLLGRPLPQNIKGDRLYSVRDEGANLSKDYGIAGVRFSKTTERLIFHTDSAPALMGNTPDVVGLFALQVAKSGGASAVVSAKTVHNVILRERPDYLQQLYSTFYFDRSVEWKPGESANFPVAFASLRQRSAGSLLPPVYYQGPRIERPAAARRRYRRTRFFRIRDGQTRTPGTV